MKHDIFFISFDETNAEANWKRLLQLHPHAKRLHAVGSISEAHVLCDQLASTECFWTIDGDNWLISALPAGAVPVADLTFAQAIDPIDETISTMGAIKLWKKGSFINTDMSRGDFCRYATQTTHSAQDVLSIHRYNATPYETWRKSFRHMAKCFAGIIPASALQQNIRKMELHKTLSIWSYRGYLDARNFIDECAGDFEQINLINDYSWLEMKFHDKY